MKFYFPVFKIRFDYQLLQLTSNFDQNDIKITPYNDVCIFGYYDNNKKI